MARVTSKLQVTIPKALAERHAIHPGDEIEWESAGDVIRVVPGGAVGKTGREARLHVFDQASGRQRRRNRSRKTAQRGQSRRWTREELYSRRRAR